MSRMENVLAFGKAGLEADAVSGPLRAKCLIFSDDASRALLGLLDRVAPSEAAIHIAGETGTGKELVARYIHRTSGRSGPFLAVNCGAISEQLAESELFGYEAGSFTGAQSRREGWFEAARGGTLFLDEIGDLPLTLQVKLLRVLQESEVTRIGSRRATPVDVRVLSASNVDLEAAVETGRFRRDLLYRLNIVPVRLPPLRDRPGDIAALTGHFLQVYSERLKRPVPVLRPDALQALRRHTWPGNIRELENVVHYALLMASDGTIGVDHLRIPLSPAGAQPLVTPELSAVDRMGPVLRECFVKPGRQLLRDIERRVIEDAYRHCERNQVRTAELLGVSRNVVRTLLKRHGLLTDLEDSFVEDAVFAGVNLRARHFDPCELNP
jgi:DNA-binding NtrC family response regulator